MMTTADRAVRNAIDLLSNLEDAEAIALGGVFAREMGWVSSSDILHDLTDKIALIRQGLEKDLPK